MDTQNPTPEKIKGLADIVILLDATGSMDSCINAGKDGIGSFVEELNVPVPELQRPINWRCKVCGYRDIDVDGDRWFEDNPFVRDAKSLKEQLSALKATGGGDIPESLLDALQKMVNMPHSAKGEAEDAQKWRERGTAQRFVLIFTDAPFKEKTADGTTVEDLALKIESERFYVTIFAPTMDCYADLAQVPRFLYEPCEEDPAAPGDAQAALAKSVSQVAKFQKTLTALARTITNSAARGDVAAC